MMIYSKRHHNEVIIGLDNGLTPIRRQAIPWTSADMDPRERTSVRFESNMFSLGVES